MFKPRALLLILLLSLSFTWLFSSGILKRAFSLLPSRPGKYELSENSILRIKSKAADAKKFVVEKDYNNRICFLVDMSLPSGQNRFFVYDLKKDTLQNSG